MLSGEGMQCRKTVKNNNRSNQQKQHSSTLFLVHFFAVVLHDYNVKLPETSQLHVLWRKCRTRSPSLFFTAAHFHLALVAACISHFVTSATQNFHVVLPTNKCLLRLFISRSKSLSPFFSLSFVGLPPTFSFSLSFSIFQICGHDHLSKFNTLDNTDTETISAFRFRLY